MTNALVSYILTDKYCSASGTGCPGTFKWSVLSVAFFLCRPERKPGSRHWLRCVTSQKNSAQPTPRRSVCMALFTVDSKLTQRGFYATPKDSQLLRLDRAGGGRDHVDRL